MSKQFKPTKGYIFLVQTTNNWFYLVRQISMKGWIATEFTHSNLAFEVANYQANSVAIVEKIGEVKDFRAIPVGQDSVLRKQMFEVLKYGRFKIL